MSSHEKVGVPLDVLEERVGSLRATHDQFDARSAKARRRREFRRKIVIGAAVLAAIEQEAVPAFQTRADLVGWLDSRLNRTADRRLFALVPRANPKADL